MKKKCCMVANLLLLAWFFLDMAGIYFEDTYLVTRSWKEDGIFMVIFVVALLFFMLREKIGKYILIGWQLMWLITQFISHEYYTIFGGGEAKMRYFTDSIKLFSSENRYIPDLYHIVLHVFIVIALISTILYVSGNKKKRIS
ncbi:hypothetical protein [Scatolibacter rhodanostii]|uniref:hypothetical protein n=1 Tax=Scatolibacter rhodanostii TaxID=2014781 RepID=UPI000C07B01C|nr:hypothetical protein [Scatolibacter rhodanostii]